MKRRIKKVLNYNVDTFSFHNTIDYIMDKISKYEGMQIVTVNPEMIELANNNEEFAEVLNEADLVVADGVGIKIALKLKGINIEQVRGIELAKTMLKRCAMKGYKVALIGAKEEILQKAITNLKQEIPNLDICYNQNGYFCDNEETYVYKNLKENKPSLILVAMGAPKQELLIKRCKEEYPVGVFIGVGGSFDVWSGEVERAPEIYQKLGLEWLYRTISQPERFKRIYKTLPVFLFKAIIEAIAFRGK